MLLYEVIIIYITIINIYFFNKRKLEFLRFEHWGDFIKSLFILISFFVLFVFFMRLMGLFRETKSIDLKYYFYNFDLTFIILFLIMLFFLRKNIFSLVKISFIKLHYFGLSDFLPMNIFYKQYTWFFFKVIKKLSIFIFRRVFWFDKIFTVIMVFFILIDLMFNNLVLNYSLWYLPFYSMFKFCYICVRFIAIRQNTLMDYYLSHYSYVGTGYVLPDDDSFYALTWQSKFMEMDKYEKEIIQN